MHPVYTREQLELKAPARLKEIAAELGAEPKGDKRLKQTWIDAIIEAQSGIEPAAPVEFNNVSWNYCECLVKDQEIAVIQYDGIVGRYIVHIDGVEVFAGISMLRSQNFIIKHHKDNTLIDIVKQERNRPEEIKPRNLLIGDVIIWDNKSWKVQKVVAIRCFYEVLLLPSDYEYKCWDGEPPQTEDEWHQYYLHRDKEYKRLAECCHWLKFSTGNPPTLFREAQQEFNGYIENKVEQAIAV